jgi:hypothetical protein
MRITVLTLVCFICLGSLAAQDSTNKKIDNYRELMSEYAETNPMMSLQKTSLQITDEKELKRIARIIFESSLNPKAKFNEKMKSVTEARLKAKGNQELHRDLVHNVYGVVERRLWDILLKNILL